MTFMFGLKRFLIFSLIAMAIIFMIVVVVFISILRAIFNGR